MSLFKIKNAIILIQLLFSISCAKEDLKEDLFVDIGYEERIFSFDFIKDNNAIEVDSRGYISQNLIEVFLPPGTDKSNLIPTFKKKEDTRIEVNGMEVESDKTPIDFTSGVELTVIASDYTIVKYTVIVITDDLAIDGKIRRLMDDFNIPGLQLSIVYKERLVYSKSYGYADKQNGLLVNNESIFRIASISKVLTLVGILKLIENDQLNFTDKIFGDDGILKFDFGTPPYSENLEDITVLHLLEHKSGWQNVPYDPVFRNEELSQDEMINDIINNRPNSEPGGDSYYLNFGYVLLGRVIEKVSGLDYESYINQQILNPIGITDMQIAENSINEKAENEVLYYPQENFDPYTMNVKRMDAAGGWLASTEDLARFLVHIDRNRRVEDILSSTSLTYSYLAYSTWIFNGGFAGTNSCITRINNDLGGSIIVNTRIPGGEITEALNDFMTEEINKRSKWATYDLFQIESGN